MIGLLCYTRDALVTRVQHVTWAYDIDTERDFFVINLITLLICKDTSSDKPALFHKNIDFTEISCPKNK